MHLRRLITQASVILLLVTGSAIVGVGDVAPASATPQSDVVSLTNTERARAGQPALKRNANLDSVAAAWAQTMSSTRNFVHSSNEWRAARIDSGWTRNGENIAYGYTSASAVMSGWMSSPGHRENILRSGYTDIGVGYVANGNYWVQVFATYPAAAKALPFGSLDSARVTISGNAATLSVAGWAIDRAAQTRAIPVHLHVTDPTGKRTTHAITANQSRADVGRAYPAAGAAHGYSWSGPVTMGGKYTVCAYGIGAAGNPLLGCSTVVHGPAAPIGHVDGASLTTIDGAPSISVSGWALDNGLRAAPTEAHVYITDPAGRRTGFAVSATGSRPDIGRAYAGAGDAHGFSMSTKISAPGRYQVCVYAISAPVFGGSNRALPCRTVDYVSTPIGSFDGATSATASRSISVSGWALDNSARAATTQVHVYVTAPNGQRTGHALTANASRPDVGRAYPGAGDLHGFSAQLPVTSTGSFTVCAFSISAPGLPSANRALPCKTVVVRG